MQKNYTQLLLGILIGLLVGLLLGKFVFNSTPKSLTTEAAAAEVLSKMETKANHEKFRVPREDVEEQEAQQPQPARATADQKIPSKVYEVLKYIKANNAAPDNYVGGRVFQNRENQLPKTEGNGKKINYQEWDVNPKVQGKNRGADRMVTGSDGRSWYTSDHYRSFTLIQ